MTTAEGHERTPRGAEASGRSLPRKLSEGTGNTMTTMALGSATAAIAPRIQLGRGVGVCGVYSYEVAEAKATQVMDYARQNEHPLQLQIEKD